MDGRGKFLAAAVLLLSAGATGSAPLIKCRGADGAVSYQQGRACPVGLHAEPLELPALGVVSANTVTKRVNKPARRPSKATGGRGSSAACEKLKTEYARTDEPCRGISGCRERQSRRQAARDRYGELRCSFTSGDIGSRYQ